MSKQRDRKVLSILGGIVLLFLIFAFLNRGEIKKGYEAGMNAECETRSD
ncbi:MAG: hypothetical protein RI572_12425 [Salegentibacter sp.]|nr:hypothetical protein [Salegentibacter sp.]MDR9458205.1 hypothetical protein [Salegentibacter sp.]